MKTLTALLLATTLLLAACGGGDPENSDDGRPDKTIQPVDPAASASR